VARRALKLALAGIALLLALLWIDHRRETKLPAPTGPFAVGRTMQAWSDAGSDRQLLAWIWYPATPRAPSATGDDYLPSPWRTAVAHHAGVLQLFTRDLSRVRTHSIRDAELSPAEPSFPVLIMRAGLAALTASYTTLAEDLASHGYVVVGFDAPHRTVVVVFPDGRVVERARENDADLLEGAERERLAGSLMRAWVADSRFALDQLERLNGDSSGKFRGRLDLQRLGVFGHSLGGATALQLCHDDARCKAGADVDGAPLGSVIGEGVTQPFLFVLSDHAGEPDAETRPVIANIHAVYDRLSPDSRLLITIPGAGHYQFSDDGALLKSPLVTRVLRALGIVRIDGRRQIALTAHYLATFFDAHLRQAP
jgi:predicted dienelactone hydrolase